MFIRNAKKKTRFSTFLSGEHARDDIHQDTPYDKQIERAAELKKTEASES